MSYYKITIAPELNLDATDFVDSWNNTEQCRAAAEAKTEAAQQGDFILGEMAVLAGLVFVGDIAKTALNELIKQAIVEYYKERQQAANTPPPKPESIEVREIEQPDGSKLVVVVLKH